MNLRDIAKGALGRDYQPGEAVFHQGEVGDSLYIVQRGQVELYLEEDGTEVHLCRLGPGDIMGMTALFRGTTRNVSVRAVDTARILTIDRRTLVKRLHEDPSLAYEVMRKIVDRLEYLKDEVRELRRGRPDP